VIGGWPPGVTKSTRISLAQFSKNLTSIENQAQPECACDSAERVALEHTGPKQFAAEVVAAMSNPRPKSC
jgi:hypothetical protein